MNILVLSDSHGCHDRLRDIVDAYAPNVDAIIFCGDGERDFASLNDLQSIHNKRIIAVAGNMDMMSMNPRTSFDELGGFKFYSTHGQLQYVKEGYDYIALDAQKNGREIVCFGHTHRQYCARHGDVYLFNPGAVLNSCYGTIHIHEATHDVTFRHWYWDHGKPVLREGYHF